MIIDFIYEKFTNNIKHNHEEKNLNFDSHYDSGKNDNHNYFNRNNSQNSDIRSDNKIKEKNFHNSPKSYTSKIKSLVENLNVNHNTSTTPISSSAIKTTKNSYLEYINKDNIQGNSGVMFNSKFEIPYNNTQNEVKSSDVLYKEGYNNTDSNFKNAGSSSNRINTGNFEYLNYNNINDMKYNAPKKDEFNLKLNKREKSKEVSDVQFHNNYMNTDDKSNLQNKNAQDIKTKIEKYYKLNHNSPKTYENFNFKDNTYSLSYKEKLSKNCDKPINTKNFNITMNKIKK